MRTGLVVPIAAVGIGGFILGNTMMLALPTATGLLQKPIEFLFFVGLHHPVLRMLLATAPAYVVFVGPLMIVLMRRRASATAHRPDLPF